jgi:hypothetical protein
MSLRRLKLSIYEVVTPREEEETSGLIKSMNCVDQPKRYQ